MSISKILYFLGFCLLLNFANSCSKSKVVDSYNRNACSKLNESSKQTATDNEKTTYEIFKEKKRHREAIIKSYKSQSSNSNKTMFQRRVDALSNINWTRSVAEINEFFNQEGVCEKLGFLEQDFSAPIESLEGKNNTEHTVANQDSRM